MSNTAVGGVCAFQVACQK